MPVRSNLILIAMLLGTAACGWACGIITDDDDDVDAEDDDVADDDDNDNDIAVGDVWIDPSSGLTWQVEPASEQLEWGFAKRYCRDLEYGGFDDWCMPTISELRSLIRGCEATVTGGSCLVADDCRNWEICWDETCIGCDDGSYGPAGLSGEIGFYWSSSEKSVDSTYDVWAIDFSHGYINTCAKRFVLNTRCVRKACP